MKHFRHDLDGVGAARACDLQDENNHTQCKPDVVQRKDERIIDQREHDAVQTCGNDEQQRVRALYADIDEISERND